MVAMGRLDQYLKQRGDRWHYVRRVPLAFAEQDRRGTIRTALGTSSLEVARARRDALAEADDAYWASLVTAPGEAALHRYRAAKKRAMAKGFLYTPIDLLAEQPVEQVVERIKAVGGGDAPAQEDVEAVLGAVPPSAPLVSKAFEIYCDEIAVSETLGKSPEQAASWRKVKRRAVNNFIAICGDLAMDAIEREHARAFYNWWSDRLKPTAEGRRLNPNSANRDLGNIRKLFAAFWEYEGEEDRENPFRNLRFAATVKNEVPPFEPDFIERHILEPGVFDGLNAEAALIVYALIETGCRPSEIANLTADQIVLDDEVPHLRIRARTDRELKSGSSNRDIPLLGISLEAMRAAPNGFPHYRDKGALLSASLLKAFRTRELLPTPAHRIYSFRHSFEKRMLEANLDYGLRCKLMGHRNSRPEYGDGGSLSFRRDELVKITFAVSPELRGCVRGLVGGSD